MAGILMEGDLFVARYNQGVPGALEEWPGVTKFAYKPNSELKEQISKGRGTYGQLLASVAITKPSDFNMSISDVSAAMFAAASQGTFAPYSVNAATATDSPFLAKKGFAIDIGVQNLKAASVIVKNAAGTTTHVEGTDYKVDYASGFITVLSGGAIVDNANVLVSYAAGAVSGSKILGGTEALIRLKLVLEGNNLNTGKKERVVVHEAALTSDGEIDLMGDDFITPSFTGRMVKPAGKPSAFEIYHDLTYTPAP